MLELMSDPAYRHVLLNHLPVTGLVVAWLVLLTGCILDKREVLLLGLGLVAVTSGSSLFVGWAGDDAYPAVFDTLGGEGRDWLDYHTQLAETWIPVLYANAVLALLAAAAGVWRGRWLRLAAIGVALATLAGLGAAGFIAEAGGKIKHPEFRLDDPPDYDAPGRLR